MMNLWSNDGTLIYECAWLFGTECGCIIMLNWIQISCKEVVCNTVGSLRWCICGEHDGILKYERSWISTHNAGVLLCKTLKLDVLFFSSYISMCLCRPYSDEDTLFCCWVKSKRSRRFESCTEHVFFFKLVKPTLTNILGAKRQRSAAIRVLALPHIQPLFSNVTPSAYFLIINRNIVLHSPLGPNILILGCSRPFTWYLPWANFLFPWCPPPSRTANGPFYSCTLGPFPK